MQKLLIIGYENSSTFGCCVISATFVFIFFHSKLKVAANVSDANDESRLIGSFSGGSQGSGVAKWKSCCRAAVDCCRSKLSTENEIESSSNNGVTYMTASSPTTSTPTCPASWDGWTCWPKTPSNQTALTKCPNYIYFGTDSPPCNRKLQFRLPNVQ